MAAALTVRATRDSRLRAPAAGLATVALGLSLAMAGCGGAAHTAARVRPSGPTVLPAPLLDPEPSRARTQLWHRRGFGGRLAVHDQQRCGKLSFQRA